VRSPQGSAASNCAAQAHDRAVTAFTARERVMPPLLSLRNVGAGYRRLQVVWGVDLDLDRGECVALIGASGAGKTALVRTIAGLSPPFGGEIWFGGENIGKIPAHHRVRLGLATVPEGRRLFNGMAVRDNLLLGAASGIASAHRLAEIHDLFPVLAERRDQIAGTLSGGEQQMCAIGRALMTGPKLLMIDELSSGLAPAVIDTLLEALVAIRRDGVALFVIDQDVGIALSCADRAYVMRSGRIVMAGPAAQVLGDPSLQQEYIGY
jgi:branched-chain amino acid transport system ATP-binding protein